MSKSQLNQMSKKQILDSLLYQQQSSSATVNRLIIALAQAVGVTPEDFAKFFVDSEGGHTYADKLNVAIDAEVTKRQASAKEEVELEDNPTV